MSDNDWKRLLKPYTDEYEAMYSRLIKDVQSLSVDAQRVLYDATSMASQTNCGWTMFETARLIRLAVPSAVIRR